MPLLQGERGETLIEVLIALMILAIAGVALLGGLATGFFSSGIHREQTDAGVLIASVGESLVSNAINPYIKCAQVTGTPGVNTYNPTADVTIPKGWSTSNVAITAVSWWSVQQNSGQFMIANPSVSPTSSSCPDNISTSVTVELQKITVTVTSSDRHVVLTRTFMKVGSS